MRFYTGVALFGSEIEGIGGFPPDPSQPGGFRFTGRQVKASSVQTVFLMRYGGRWWRVDVAGTDSLGKSVYGMCGPTTWTTGGQNRNVGENTPRDDYFSVEPAVVIVFPWQNGWVWVLVDRAAMGYSGYLYSVGSGYWMLKDRADARPPHIEGVITGRDSPGYCGGVDYELAIW